VGSSMLEALVVAGKVSKEAAAREEGLRQFQLTQTASKPTSEGFTLLDLEGAETIGAFEHVAKTALLAGSVTTVELVRAANALKSRLGQTDPVQRLVALTYHLRDHLQGDMPDKERGRIIKAAFRKAGSKFPDNKKDGGKKHR